MLANRGDVVNPGTAILSVEVLSENLQAVLFVPASAGKKVQPGMTVRVSPSTVKREEYGSMLGKVTWVAEFPSTSRGMTRLLGNDALVTKLMEQGPPIQVNVALDARPCDADRLPLVLLARAEPQDQQRYARPPATSWSRRTAPSACVIPKVREATGL